MNGSQNVCRVDWIEANIREATAPWRRVLYVYNASVDEITEEKRAALTECNTELRQIMPRTCSSLLIILSFRNSRRPDERDGLKKG